MTWKSVGPYPRTGVHDDVIWTLAATAAATLLSAGVYGGLALLLWDRPGDAPSRRATRAFAAYWAFTAAYQALAAVQHALAAVGLAPFAGTLAVRLVGLALASAGLAGLLTFFAYLLAGSHRYATPILVTYVFAASLAWVHVLISAPVGVATTPWTVDVAYANDFQGGLFLPLLVLFQLVPIVAALWYATLARHAEGARQRYRVLAVGIGVALQLLAFLAARVTEAPVWQLVSRTALAAVVGLLVASAYFGPLAARKNAPYGI